METSGPWDGTAVGDASRAPYSAGEWDDMYEAFLQSDGNRGVFMMYLDGLIVGGVASPLTLFTGAAVVKGKWYKNTTNLNLITTGSPAAATRTDYIILRRNVDAGVQTVRAVWLENPVEGTGTPPALTQVDAGIWEIPLYELDITVGGVVTLRDVREPFGQYGMLDFVPAQIGYNFTDAVEVPVSVYQFGVGQRQPGILMADTKNVQVYGRWVPKKTTRVGTGERYGAIPVIMPSGATGAIWVVSQMWVGGCGEIAETVLSGSTTNPTLTPANAYNCLDRVSVPHTEIGEGDIILLNFQRRGDLPADTLGADCYFVGWKITTAL